MLWVPQKGIVRMEHNIGTVGATTIGTSVTTGAAASTKTSPMTQLIASTSFDAYWLRIVASNYGLSATDARGCLDIGIGAATEETIIANLLMGRCGGATSVGTGPKVWDFPLYIPAGSRLAAATAGSRTSTACFVAVFLYGGNGYPPFRVGSRVDTYGIGTVPAGTTVTPGYSGAEGNWTQVTASTTVDHFCVVPSFQTGDDTTFTPIENFVMDIGVGAATEEALLGVEQSYCFTADTNEFNGGPWNSFPCFQDIPSGSRLSVRLSASGVAQTTNVPQVALHCVS